MPTPTATEFEAPPCDGVDHDLGVPFVGGRFATFTTGGGALWVMAAEGDGSGILSSSRTAFHVGPGDVRPAFDREQGEVVGATTRVGASLTRWVQLDLPAGAWWLWSSAGGRVTLRACDGDVTDVSQNG